MQRANGRVAVDDAAPVVGVGAVTLVAGYGAFAQPARVAATVAALGRIGEAFLDGRPGWRLQRLAPGDAEVPTRVGLRRAIDRLVATDGPCVLVMVGAVVSTALGPALACASELGDYPEDTTLPLAWISERLGQYRGDGLVCVLVSDGDERDRQRWMKELVAHATGLIVVASATADALDAMLDALWGDALDDATGTVTPRALGSYLAARLPTAAIRDSLSPATLVVPNQVATGHEPRLSRLLAGRSAFVQERGLIGRVLPGRLRVEAEIGRGGFGVVYRAHQDLLRRHFALKVLSLGEQASREDAELFLQEIRAVARLDHRNVVRVHFADVLGRRQLFFAMELLAGRDLQRILDEDGALVPERALALATQLLAGLGAAHDAGLVHADIKPANLIVTDDEAGERLVLVDFGLSRLRAPEPARAVGGTIAFMAPEQRREGIVDQRSDLYSAARVLLAMLTGRVDDTIDVSSVTDHVVRDALARALADEPAARFESAAEMSAALRGTSVRAATAAPRPPFRHAAPFVELDRDDFHGRERDVANLVDAVLFRRCVVYAAPSGVGKTSLLRAGLLPRLADLGIRGIYVGCRVGAQVDLESARALDTGSRVVLVLDQLEAVLQGDSSTIATLFARLRELVTSPHAQVTVVLSVREELLGRVLEHAAVMSPGAPLRLGPLTIDDARHAISLTMHARRLAIAPDLLDALIADLEHAARGMPAQLGWGDSPAVYPPHLQLAGAVLYDALPANVSTFTLDAYRRLGGLPGIIGEHLHRVLEDELTPARTAIARSVLLALVTNSRTRNSLPESELVAIVATDASAVREVVHFLRDRGLVVALAAHDGDLVWELAHDSLVPRIEAWVTATDLARLRALELIRSRLRRSERGSPSLLDVGELREVGDSTKEADLTALDAEWAGRVELGDDDKGRPASTLVALSRRAVRARRIALVSALCIAAAVVAGLAYRWQVSRAENQRNAVLRAGNVGTFTVRLSAFDWDPVTHRPVDVPVAELPELELYVARSDVSDPGRPDADRKDDDVYETTRSLDGPLVHEYEISARGGEALIVVQHRGRRRADGTVEECGDSIIPAHHLPGYLVAIPQTYLVRVPTCDATRADMVDLPAGPFIAGGAGDPPVSFASQLPPERVVELAPYALDRTEVTNAAFAMFAGMADLHDIAMPAYPETAELHAARGPDYPVSDVNWPEARAYCRYMGKDLPTLDQWDRALRGGLLVGGVPNPAPRRTFAWPGGFVAGAAAVPDAPSRRHPFPVGAHPTDTSPDGIVDLAGNLQEWVLASPPAGDADVGAREEATRAAAWRISGPFRIMRGCNWSDLECAGGSSVGDFTALPNQREYDLHNYRLGLRCRFTRDR